MSPAAPPVAALITAAVIALPAPAQPPKPDAPAFDGTTLKGWTAEAAGADGWKKPSDGVWSVEDKALVGRAARDGADHYLVSDAEYADFTLKAEVQLGVGANAGIVVRGKDREMLPIDPAGNNTVPGHPVVKLYDSDVFKVYRSGTTHWLKDYQSFVGPTEKILTGHTLWYPVEVDVRGEALTVRIDKTKVVDLKADTVPAGGFTPGLGRAKGRVGFQVLNGEVRFRNIQVRTLEAKK